MTYNEAYRYLLSHLPSFHQQGKSAYKSDLSNALALDSYFTSPHKHFKTIHITGTNGKGSTSHMLASVLQSAGYRTGLFTSPHLIDFRERIRINGTMISKKYVSSFVAKHRAIIDFIQPSFYELSVSLAFEYFREKNVHIAIIEVGLGGRLDSTNIISPLVSVITNVGLEHTDILGNSMEAIAKEKAGIIKKKCPVVIGKTQKETKKIFTSIAQQNKSPIYFADKTHSVVPAKKKIYNHQHFFALHKRGKIYSTDLGGWYQQQNISTVLCTISLLQKMNISIPEKAISEGLRHVIKYTGLMGRWQLLQKKPKVLVDVAHNPDGIKMLCQEIEHYRYRKLHIIFGVVKDKNIKDMITLLPAQAEYYFTKANNPRFLDEDELQRYAADCNRNGKAYKKSYRALQAALQKASMHDLIVICGSNFLIGEILKSYTMSPKQE